MAAYDFDKERFLDEFGRDYGYPNAHKNVDEIRATEFKRLNDIVYLDHAGATLYSESQMEDAFKDLNSTLYGNPHSQSSCSLTTSDIIDEARRDVLNFFNASPEEYKCIFTSGATAALKLVGETFPWSCQSTFMYTMENHNSVLGIREYALNKRASSIAVDVSHHDKVNNGKCGLKITPRNLQRRYEASDLENEQSDTYNLFAFPSECNFSGQRFNLDLVPVFKEELYGFPVTSSCHRGGCWMVLIDAAKGSSTEPPDLSTYKADFVVVSFYKLFGYPTGIGALIVRNDAAKLLKKTYFSGGTVAASIADIDYYKRREGVEECFEDGTLSFVSIASLRHGFKILNSLTMPSISRHAHSLATYVRNALINLRHANGYRVCTLYGLTNPKLFGDKMGPTVSFNLKRPDGSWFGYREVEKLASLSNIQLRTGCFCNPGACAKFLGLSHSDLPSNIESGHVCWDDHDILNGKPTGAVRVSFGYMSTYEDAERFLRFIKSSFVSQSTNLDTIEQKLVCPVTEGNVRDSTRCYLKSITVYPIKSCAGFDVESWPLNSTGLLHDREWLLKSLTGEILTQKKVPELAFITTSIDLNLGLLHVKSPRCKETLHIDLKSNPYINETQVMKIYSQRYEVQGYKSEVDAWFTNAIGRPCKLVRSFALQNHVCSNDTICRDVETKLNFVNEAQFLLISEESIADVNNRLKSKLENGLFPHPIEVDHVRFRPNLVFSGGKPYVEDEWSSVKIGDTHFTSLGGCNRCQMINMSPKCGTVQRSNEPLATLASYRRVKGKIYFGILLRPCDSIKQDSRLAVGEQIIGSTHCVI